jgi:hypothetical protein
MSADDYKLAPTTPGLYVRAKPGLVLRDEKGRRLLRKLRIACPWIEDSDTPIARRYCELEVLISQAYAYIRRVGVVNESGNVVRAVDDYRRLVSTQAALADKLGLTPASRAQIRADKTTSYVDADAIPLEVSERALAMAKKPVVEPPTAVAGEPDE